MLALLAGLTACARPAEGAASAGAASPAPGQTDAGELPDVMRLAVGTLKLDEGSLAVDAGQAAGLLPLWKAYGALSASDTAVQLELEALVAQIQETMSPEQTRAIAEMELTVEDMAALTRELGISAMGAGSGADQARGTDGETSGRQGRFAGGGAPPGGFEGGFPGGPGGLPGAPGMMAGGRTSGAASGATQATRMRAAAFSPLIDAVIHLLEAKE